MIDWSKLIPSPDAQEQARLEAAEAARQARVAAILDSLRSHGMTGQESAADIEAKASQIQAMALPDDFGADREAAEALRAKTVQALYSLYETARLREATAAELVQLRAEVVEAQAAREAAEAETRAERERAEVAEQARKDAETRVAELEALIAEEAAALAARAEARRARLTE